MRWVRAAELTCDRAALLVAQDPEVRFYLKLKLFIVSPVSFFLRIMDRRQPQIGLSIE